MPEQSNEATTIASLKDEFERDIIGPDSPAARRVLLELAFSFVATKLLTLIGDQLYAPNAPQARDLIGSLMLEMAVNNGMDMKEFYNA